MVDIHSKKSVNVIVKTEGGKVSLPKSQISKEKCHGVGDFTLSNRLIANIFNHEW